MFAFKLLTGKFRYRLFSPKDDLLCWRQNLVWSYLVYRGRKGRCASRRDIALHTGLDRKKVGAILDELEALGLVELIHDGAVAVTTEEHLARYWYARRGEAGEHRSERLVYTWFFPNTRIMPGHAVLLARLLATSPRILNQYEAARLTGLERSLVKRAVPALVSEGLLALDPSARPNRPCPYSIPPYSEETLGGFLPVENAQIVEERPSVENAKDEQHERRSDPPRYPKPPAGFVDYVVGLKFPKRLAPELYHHHERLGGDEWAKAVNEAVAKHRKNEEAWPGRFPDNIGLILSFMRSR